MKELSIEEKAKAYDEALERAKKWYNAPNIDKMPTYGSRIIEEIFPELKESEDERIRKAIVELVHDTTGDSLWVDYGVHKEDALAWLEKQGEQKPTIYHKFRAGDIIRHIKHGFTCKIDSVDTEYRVSECGSGTHLPFDSEDSYELVEQKPAWSEEDERNLDWLITVCERIHYKSDPQVSPKGALVLKDWLKSLKDRVQPKPKQEWTMQDEEELQIALDTLVKAGQHSSAKWLKNVCLVPQSQWKPSDEQMNILWDVIGNLKLDNYKHVGVILNLYQDLKKLMEE